MVHPSRPVVFLTIILMVALCRISAVWAEPAGVEFVVKVKAPPERPQMAITRAVVEQTRRVLEKRLPPEVRVTVSHNDSRNLQVDIPAALSQEKVEWLLRTRGILDFREPITGGGWEVAMGDFLVAEAVFRESPKTQALGPMVRVTLTTEGAREFSIVTARLMGRPMGIFLDDHLLSCPVVREPIRGGVFDITGFKSDEEARAVAAVLASGALGVELKILRKIPLHD